MRYDKRLKEKLKRSNVSEVHSICWCVMLMIHETELKKSGGLLEVKRTVACWPPREGREPVGRNTDCHVQVMLVSSRRSLAGCGLCLKDLTWSSGSWVL